MSEIRTRKGSEATTPECFGCDNWYQSANCDGGELHSQPDANRYVCGLPVEILIDRPRQKHITDAGEWQSIVSVRKCLSMPIIGMFLLHVLYAEFLGEANENLLEANSLML